MTKSEILEVCKNYYIANTDMASRLRYAIRMKFVMPALCGVSNKALTYIDSEDNDGLHANFYTVDGMNTGTVSSNYAAGDYVYVREAFFLDDGGVKYAADDPRRCRFEKEKVIGARYMKKSQARTFFRVKGVSLKRLHDIKCDELHEFGYKNFDSFFDAYDKSLSEKQYEYSRSEFNPYVFVYDIETVRYDVVSSRPERGIKWYEERGLPVPGSYEDVAKRQRERDKLRTENEIRKAAVTEPSFGRMLDAIKGREGA